MDFNIQADDEPGTRTNRPPTYLSDADGEVLDALLAVRGSGARTGPMPTATAERVEKLRRLLALLETYEADAQAPDDLAERTIQHIQAERQRLRFAEQVQMLSQPHRSMGVSWGQVAAAVAVFLIGASLLLPVLDRNRAEARRLACEANLAGAGFAMNSYAADHAGVLPRLPAVQGQPWWQVGQSAGEGQPVNSNSAHLFVLVRNGYISAEKLACPANEHAPKPGQLTAEHHDWPNARAVSYSYQNQFGPAPIRPELRPYLVVLADKNPLFVTNNNHLAFDTTVPPWAPSRQHEGRGQNILVLDGAVRWTTQPDVMQPNGHETDNIWSARGVHRYTGTETPAGPDDSFLVP